MIVLFVGSNPSASAKTQNPFCMSTKSGQLLCGWINSCDYAGGTCYANVKDTPTENNRPLTTKEIKANLDLLKRKIDAVKPGKIIALGKTAEKALTLLRADFYAMPHPSGLNRQLNDPKFVEEKIKGLKVYLSDKGPQAL